MATKRRNLLGRGGLPRIHRKPARVAPPYTSRIYAWLPPAPTAADDVAGARQYHLAALELLDDGPPVEPCPACDGRRVIVLAESPELIVESCGTCDGRGVYGPAPLTVVERKLLTRLAVRWGKRATGQDRRWALVGNKPGRLSAELEDALRPPADPAWTMNDPIDNRRPTRPRAAPKEPPVDVLSMTQGELCRIVTSPVVTDAVRELATAELERRGATVVSTGEPQPATAELPIEFTQYLRPNGERKPVWVERPADIARIAVCLKAAGWGLDIEQLRDNTISMTVSPAPVFAGFDEAIIPADYTRAEWNASAPIATELAPNGPAVLAAVDKLITTAARRLGIIP